MKLRSLILAAAASIALASPAFALCQQQTVATPNNASNPQSKIQSAGGSLGGTAYTKATFCPAAAAAGTCTGESLAEKSPSVLIAFNNFDGDVPDYTQRRIGVQVGPIWIGTPWQGTAEAPKTCP
jgi:hypothetical protein